MTATINSYNEQLSKDYFLVASHDLDLETPDLLDYKLQEFIIIGANDKIKAHYDVYDSLSGLEISGLTEKSKGILEVILIEGSAHGALNWLADKENNS